MTAWEEIRGLIDRRTPTPSRLRTVLSRVFHAGASDPTPSLIGF
ncbi:hypothetical protein ACFQVD_18730 [Streptosporangium amethystogenes subsp. fukuiense]|uniref:Uncharacterized protein n=1 Tax=Streptosporangium amethystogenes subsp. fukuiense TaxID=698418 RepID=A0ABW2T3A5_9ACTN